MNEAKQQQALASQTGLARKVYNVVPIQAIWGEHAILSALRTAGVSAGPHTVRACLRDMKESGLVREPSRGQFQRTPVTPKILKPISEPTMHPVKEVVKKSTPTPLDLLGALSAELVIVGNEFHQRLKSMANRVEEVALSIETQREADANAMAKVQQLQTLLKEIGT